MDSCYSVWIGDYGFVDWSGMGRPCSQTTPGVAWLSRESDELVFTMDLPGVKRDDVSVSISEGELACAWKRDKKERSYAIRVGEIVSATAKLEDGVLTVRMRERGKERIEVKVE